MLKRLASWALKLGLTAASVWYLQQKVDLHAAWMAGKDASAMMLALALLLQVVQILTCTLRWKMVLRAANSFLPFFQACGLFSMGTFFGQVLPGAVGGDAVRAWKTHRAGLPLATAISSVALERVVTVLGLVLLVTATQPLLLDRLPDPSIGWLFPILTVGSFFGIGLLCLLDRLPARLTHLKLVRGFISLAGDSRRLFLRPRNAVPTLLVTLFGHVNLALVVWALGLAVGADLSALDCIVLVPPVVLVATLPISIAGWGVREAAMIQLLGFVGVSPAHAAAISVLFGLSGLIVALPGGLFWLFSPDHSRPAEELEA